MCNGSGYDVIGDVHGQAGKLEALLKLMGYEPSGRGYKAPAGRQAVFLGDLIDRGPGQVRVVEIARAMVESGDALCVMGNHEFNAIAYVTNDPSQPGEALRPNRGESKKCAKNRAQHAEFLLQVGEGSQLHRSMVEWFRTLPPFMDLGGIRVVHGNWDDEAIDTLKAGDWGPGQPLTNDVLIEACRITSSGEESPLMRARKRLTCGLEIDLPPGVFIEAKGGMQFDNVRIANWRDWAKTLDEVALVPAGQEAVLKSIDWPADLVISRIEGAPIFVGHHWFSGHPVIESPKLACLDWSAGKGGPLVAYRWDGETELSNDQLVWAA